MTESLPYFLAAFLLANLIFEVFVEYLNLSRLSLQVPIEFAGVYSTEKYAQAQKYLKVNTKFGLIESSFTTAIMVTAIALNLFEYWDQTLRGMISSEEWRGVLFIGGLGLIGQLLALPFKIWDTFVIEQQFGFNRTTPLLFFVDLLKGWALAIILGAPFLFGFLWIWNSLGTHAWIWGWVFLTAVQLFMMFIAPVTIMPLFNKFKPLADGALKTAIEGYAQQMNFKMQGIFTMDGSKRSTKANAYFTGFGRFRRIVLFDTLIQKHTQEELMAVLAHEVGHFKLKHIFRQLYLSLFVSAVTLFLMSLFIGHPLIFKAFGVTTPSTYAGFLFFGVLYAPISTLVSMYSLYLSRRYEFEADDFSKKTYGNPLALAEALKKLSADNLSNLQPHPLKVFLEYTHPPVLQRLEHLTSTDGTARPLDKGRGSFVQASKP